MSDESKKVKRALARKGKTPKATPAKVINRRGGGTPPSQVVTSPKRIEGIKAKLIENLRLLPETTDAMISHVKFGMNMSDGMEIEVTPEIASTLAKAVAFAKKGVPDWVKLPRTELGNEFFTQESAPKRKRQSLPGPKVLSSTRIRPFVETVTPEPIEITPEPTITSTPAKPKDRSHLLVAAASRR